MCCRAAAHQRNDIGAFVHICVYSAEPPGRGTVPGKLATNPTEEKKMERKTRSGQTMAAASGKGVNIRPRSRSRSYRASPQKHYGSYSFSGQNTCYPTVSLLWQHYSAALCDVIQSRGLTGVPNLVGGAPSQVLAWLGFLHYEGRRLKSARFYEQTDRRLCEKSTDDWRPPLKLVLGF